MISPEISPRTTRALEKPLLILFTAAFFCLPQNIRADSAGKMAHVPLIVDWGHDWGSGWYRQTPEHDAKPATRNLVKEDLNANGTTDDDYTGGWAYSWDEPLSPTNLVYDWTYPSAKFYGAAILQVTDIPAKEGGGYENVHGPTEGHINQNHELRDDWNLMSFPTKKREPGISRYAAALLMFWKKEDFLNGGSEFPVSFGPEGTIGVFISRYWGGVNWGRWVVRDNGQFYVSEPTFAGETKQFDLENTGEENGAKNPVVRTTHVIRPAEVKWAAYNPEPPDKVFFDAAKADFQPREFKNVEAAGFLAQRDLSKGFPVAGGLWNLPHGIGEPVALKVNAFQARADIARPPEASLVVEMVPLGPANQPALFAAKTETTYQQWLEVVRWAVTNQRAGRMTAGFEELDLGGFTFLRDGAMGSAETGAGKESSPLEPVTGISWYDAIVWSNALSLLEGRTPAYYEDAEFTKPYQHIFDRSKKEKRDERAAVYWRRDAGGYRLPTAAEFALLAGGASQPQAASAWIGANAGGATKPAATLPALSSGLHDVMGNVAEWVWDAEGDAVDAPVSLTAMGGSFRFPEDENASSLLPHGERPFEGSPSIGFRVVRNGTAGAPALPKANGLPVRVVAKDAVVPPKVAADPGALFKEVMAALDPKNLPGAGSLPVSEKISETAQKGEPYDLMVSSVEVPYKVWSAVRQWAEKEKGYLFNYAGDMGSARFLTPETVSAKRTPNEPVTNISWLDAAVWCNALSELSGKKPVYVDVESGEPLRDASTHRVDTYREYAYANEGRYTNRPVDTAAVIAIRADTANDGFRLPTIAEYETFHKKSKEEDLAWFATNSGMRTHPVGSKSADLNGLFDVEGNVAEWTYGGDGLFGQARFSTNFGDAPGIYPHQMCRKESPFVGRSYLGFRPVSRATSN